MRRQTRKNKKKQQFPRNIVSSCGCSQAGGANEITSSISTNSQQNITKNTNINTNQNKNKTTDTNLKLEAPDKNSKNNKKINISKIKPEDVNSMSNEEIESLISGNPEVFAGLTNNLADYKEAKQNKLQSNLVQLNRKIHNSTEKISSIMNSVVKEERDRTEGYYVIGLNIMSVLDYLFKNTSNTNKKNNKTKNYKSQFKKLGEFINVNKDEIDYLKPKLLKQSQNNSANITNNTTIKNLAIRSTKFNNGGKISPLGLLTMTRTLFMTKKNENQWLKVVYLLELIFNNVGRIQHLTREEFFSQKTPLDMELFAELEEIYNTQDIFDIHKGGINTEAYEFYSRQD